MDMLHFYGSGEVEYPTSDGEPMGETDIHRQLMVDLIEALRAYYRRGSDDVYVSGNLLMYYEKGIPQSVLSPDVMVVLGVKDGLRETYKVWEEGKAPDLIIEVTSRSTKFRDVGVKRGLYEALGVREYLLFDPRAEYLKPRFQAYRLEDGQFVRDLIPEGVYVSEATGLEFRVVDDALRIFEAAGGAMLPNPQEEYQRVERLEAEVRELRARLDL